MGGYFTDILAWQEAIILLQMVRSIADTFIGPDAQRAASQLLQATESISANIAEGYGKGFCPDYVRYLKIAISSAGEVESRLVSSLAVKRSKDEAGLRLAIRQARRTRSLTEGLKRYVEREIAKRSA